MRTCIFTQSYRDSGFEGLIPVGVAFHREFICDGKADGIREIREYFEQQGIEFVFNCQFTFTTWGHPDNGKFTVECIGDAYKMPIYQYLEIIGIYYGTHTEEDIMPNLASEKTKVLNELFPNEKPDVIKLRFTLEKGYEVI